MQYINEDIEGIDGSTARFSGYVIDNSPEIVEHRVRPAVLILPGGGYEMTSDREAEPVALNMVGRGFHAFVLRYATWPSQYPVSLIQAAAAMSMIREHADEWHVDPKSIVVMGFSAGGHLAGNLATTASDEVIRAHGYDPDAVRPNGMMLGYPVISSGQYGHRGSFEHLLGDRCHDEATLDEVSIEKHIDGKTPPTFLWCTYTDEILPIQNSLMLTDAYSKAGVNMEIHIFSNGIHGLSLGTEETAWQGVKGVEDCVQTWPDLFAAWMRRTFMHNA